MKHNGMTSHMRGTRSPNELECCNNCFGCTSCLNLRFFKTTAGVIKILELVIGSICQSLLLNFGLKYASIIGFSYDTFLSTVAACLMTSSILLLCYIVSTNSMNLIRASIFEITFNTVACLSHFSSSSFLVTAVNMFLYPYYLVIPFYTIYPIMIGVYILGFILGIIYGYDAYMAYKYYMGYR